MHQKQFSRQGFHLIYFETLQEMMSSVFFLKLTFKPGFSTSVAS